MESTVARFVHALRCADLLVSPAETLDALEVVRQVGVTDRRVLHDALALTLAKTREEKQRFSDTFERFFGQLAFQAPPKPTLLRGVDLAALRDRLAAYGGEPLRELVDEVLSDDRALLAWRVQILAEALGVQDLRALRDKRILADELQDRLGGTALDTLLLQPELASQGTVLGALRYVRQYLRDELQRYVDGQYALVVDASGKRALLEAALAGNLDQLPPGYYEDAARVVQKLAA